jgi:hypothetical protein
VRSSCRERTSVCKKPGGHGVVPLLGEVSERVGEPQIGGNAPQECVEGKNRGF